MKTTVTVTLALLLVLSLVVPAFAHAQLVSASPKDGESLPTADEVVLTFNEKISPDFIQLVVEGPDGDVLDGDPVVTDNVLTQAIAPTSSGAYSLIYRVVSADGHPVSGEISFTLTDVPAPPADTDATTIPPGEGEPTPTEAAATTDAATSAATSPTPITPGDADGDSTSSALLWGVVILGVLMAAAALYALFGRRRPEH